MTSGARYASTCVIYIAMRPHAQPWRLGGHSPNKEWWSVDLGIRYFNQVVTAVQYTLLHGPNYLVLVVHVEARDALYLITKIISCGAC